MASIIKADTLQSTTSNVFVLNSAGTEYARFDSSGVFQLANPTTFPAGTAALPSITTLGDTNTGIFFPAADTIAFSEGGVEAVRIDSSGNVKMTAANTKILNSSGNPILQQTGSVLQVVSTTKTDAFSTTSTSYVDITGLSVSITPTSNTSKILAIVSLSGSETVGWGYQLVRNSTAICIGDSGGGSRMQGSGGMSTRDSNGINNPSVTFLDSPATTSATTYKVQMYTPSATGYLNRTAGDVNANYTVRSASTITVMEIAA